MSLIQLIEKSREVTIPGVGTLVRVEQLAPDGEQLGVEYRWPAHPKPAPIDHPLTFVVFVTAAVAHPFVPVSISA
jgi:hypothetical protein